MSVTAPAGFPAGGGFAPALSAVRARRGLVALLLVVAAVGWWWTGDQMRGMDNGPWTALGTFGRFVAVWAVMMGANSQPPSRKSTAPREEEPNFCPRP